MDNEMIKLRKYCVGVKPKTEAQITLRADALEETDENLFVLLIPESIV